MEAVGDFDDDSSMTHLMSLMWLNRRRHSVIISRNSSQRLKAAQYEPPKRHAAVLPFLDMGAGGSSILVAR